MSHVRPSARAPAPGERWLRPLDAARGRVLLAARPWSSRLAAERAARVGILGLTLVVTALMLALRFPLWLLALGPLLLGVPHLLADLRYCGLRTGLLTRRRMLVAGGLPVLAVGFGAGLWVGLVGVAAVCLLSDGAWRLRLAGALVSTGAAWAAARHPIGSTLVMAHFHNFVAVLMWWFWRPRPRAHALVLLALGGASVFILSGYADACVDWESGATFGSLSAAEHLARLAPDLPAHWGLRLVLLYAFAQSIHYGVWLQLVREDDRARATPRTFRASYRVLYAEFGPWVLCLAALVMLGLLAWALLDLAAARDGYFRISQFHGSLELCALALMVCEGRPCSSPGSKPLP